MNFRGNRNSRKEKTLISTFAFQGLFNAKLLINFLFTEKTLNLHLSKKINQI